MDTGNRTIPFIFSKFSMLITNKLHLATKLRRAIMRKRGFFKAVGLSFFFLIFSAGAVTGAENVIKLGVTTTLSGAASVWGLTQTWAVKEAVKKVNEAGGITIQGKPYKFEVIAYDNKYKSADGATVANKLVFGDKVNFIIATMGSAPTLATLSITEPQKILTFSSAWSKKAKGPNRPHTFCQINTPVEIWPTLVPYIIENYPNAKTVACIAPNDATGWDAMKVAVETWQKAGLKVVAKEYYERGTTEFYPIVTKLKAAKPDIVDINTAPPGEAALIFRGLKEMGWDGIKVCPGMMGLAKFIEAAGNEIAEGTYLGLTPDFTGPLATPAQRKLYEKCLQETGSPLDAVAIGSYDAFQALLAALKTADSLDSTVLAETLSKIAFEGSYGWSVFGEADIYGTPCQILIPVRITRVQKGKGVDVAVRRSPELKARLKELGIKTE